MSRVLAEVAGKIATLLGYDGTDFRNVHVDAAGDLQVDALTVGNVEKALVSDGTEHMGVWVQSSVLPAGAATSARQAYLYSRFQDQAFTYKGQVYQKNSHTKVGDGTYTQLGAAVPAGEIWIITGMTANDWQTQLVVIYVGLDKSGTQYWGGAKGSPAAKEGVYLPSPMVLVEGDKPAAYYYGALNNDALTMTVIGYSMTKAS